MILRGFVQAGGGSTRFGVDKALAQIAGRSMLQRTAELLASVCEDVTVVASVGKYGGAGWPLLADGWPGEGPLGGILTALSTMQKGEPHGVWGMNVSCDMPFLTKEFLTFLRERASASKAKVVVPQSANGLEPLCACWRGSSAADVRLAFDSGVRKVTEAMKRLPMEVLDETVWKRFDTSGRLFWNMNTATDFEQARRILETRD
jgi:molybdopterin-guanine dinucleotide biosynthesis protein A